MPRDNDYFLMRQEQEIDIQRLKDSDDLKGQAEKVFRYFEAAISTPDLPRKMQ
jgi:hypothetical protein